MTYESEKVWLVTGAATGLGLAIAEHALGEGHKVVATARGKDRLQILARNNPQNLLACQLDGTSQQDIETAVATAIERFGRCCQSNRNLSPIDRASPFRAGTQFMRVCHSAKAAERRVL